MKLSKICRKLNEKLLKTLDILAEQADKELEGFTQLTHTVQFDLFPSSILVICHFENEESLQQSLKSGAEKNFQKLLHKQLNKRGILLKDARDNLKFELK